AGASCGRSRVMQPPRIAVVEIGQRSDPQRPGPAVVQDAPGPLAQAYPEQPPAGVVEVAQNLVDRGQPAGEQPRLVGVDLVGEVGLDLGCELALTQQGPLEILERASEGRLG